MKNVTLLLIVALLVGCSSAPKQTEPKGKLVPVYQLQNELNERPLWRKDGEQSLQEQHNAAGGR